jgi:hypothetical protein
MPTGRPFCGRALRLRALKLLDRHIQQSHASEHPYCVGGCLHQLTKAQSGTSKSLLCTTGTLHTCADSKRDVRVCVLLSSHQGESGYSQTKKLRES